MSNQTRENSGTARKMARGQFNGQLFTLFLAFTVTHFTGVNPWKLKLDRGDTDALVGSSFNVTCTLNPVFAASSKTNSSNLVIAFEYIGIGEYIPIEKYFIRVIDGNSIQLQYPRLLPEFVNTLQYVTCYRNNNIRDAASLSLKVKERHRIQPRVTPLYVDNWEQLCLGWEAEKETERYFPLAYQTWYRNEISTTVFSRIENCDENGCKLPDPYRLALPGDVLIVKVNGSARTVYSEGILETVTSDDVRVNLTECLRPRKVEHIDVIQDQSNKTLVFQPPKTNRLIRYDINVTCNKHSFVKALNITRLVTDIATHSDQNSQNTSVVEPLVGLPPYSNCTVSVRAISVNGGNWSEWTHHNFQTLQDVPLAVPRSCTSCFQVEEEGKSAFFDIIVYLTPLSEEEARGRVEGYKIRTFQNDDVIPKVMELSSESLYSSSFLLSNLSNGSDYKISIEAKTQKGYNETLNLSSIIRVPESKYRTQPVSYKVIVVILNETAVRTTWVMKKRTDIEKIFLFWCNGNVENYRPCKKPLKWKEILFTFNSSVTYIIKLDKGESSNGYIFGTGIERNGKSSGITWNICTYDIKDAPPKPHIGNFKSTSSTISFPLFESSCERFGPEQGFIIGYRVFFCPVPSSNSPERKCLEDARSFDFNGSHDVLNLNDLRSNQSYRVVIQSLSETRTSENVTYDVTTLAAEIDVVPVVVVVAVVVFAAVVIIVTVMAFMPVKGKPLWRYFKDALTIGIIVIPPTAWGKQPPNLGLEETTFEDDGYPSRQARIMENEADALFSRSSGNYSKVSATGNNSTRMSSPPDRAVEFLEPVGSSNDLVVNADVSVAVDVSAAYDGPVTVDVPVPVKGHLAADDSVTFNDPLTVDDSAGSIGPGPVTIDDSAAFDDLVNVSHASNDSVDKGALVASEAPANVDAAIFVSSSVCVNIKLLGPTESYSSVEDSGKRILPSLLNDSTRNSNSAIRRNILKDETDLHQLQPCQEPASSKMMLHTPPSVYDSFVPDQCYVYDATDQSLSDQFDCETPLNHNEGYVHGSQRVCDIFLPVPHEPAQPVMLDSNSEFMNDGSAAEEAVSSFQSDLSDMRNENISTGNGHHCTDELPSRSADFICDDTRSDSDYPPMRIIELGFYNVSGTLEKELLANDVTISDDAIIISDDVTISADSQIPVTASTGDIISTDVLASRDVMTISNDVVLKKRVNCSSKDILSLGQDCNPSEAVDEDCVYSTVIDVNVSSRELGLDEPVLPALGEADDGYHSGVGVLGSLPSSSRSQASDRSEEGCWPLVEVEHDQMHAKCSISPVSLNSSSSILSWPLHHQSTDSETLPSRVLPSILPPCL